jgi:hypothetical protein
MRTFSCLHDTEIHRRPSPKLPIVPCETHKKSRLPLQNVETKFDLPFSSRLRILNTDWTLIQHILDLFLISVTIN